MEVFRICFFLVILGLNQLNGQFFEDFSDNDLSFNPEWQGDLANFNVNDAGELQLAASSAGRSSLLTPFKLESNFQWDINFELDFSPSNSNKLQIHLFSENADLENSSGYFLQIGETGSDDALELINAGDGKPVSRGIPGRVATGPVRMNLRIVLLDGGNIEISSQLENENVYTSEMIVGDIVANTGDSFFGLTCIYTATRSDKFIFKTIELNNPSSDESSPRLIDILESGPEVICLRFNEVIDEELSNQEVLISVGGEFVEELSFAGRELKLNYNTSAASGPIDISITGISDAAGNRLDTMAVFIKEARLESGSILINEILFDPVPGGDDFVEFINTTDQFIELKNLIIQNTISGRSVDISTSQILEPFGLIVFAEDKDQLLTKYKSANASLIIEHALPAFPNNSGNVTLLQQGIVMDFFNYSDDLHHDLLDETEGVSLERRTTELNGDEPEVWTSASESSGYATPGTENSSNLIATTADVVTLKDDSFSPNGDGDNDVLEMTISPGFESLGSVWIYDQSGNLIHQLRSNTLLGSQDVISWDGRMEDGNQAPIGIYIIKIEVFNTGGQVYSYKKAVALVDFID